MARTVKGAHRGAVLLDGVGGGGDEDGEQGVLVRDSLEG
jgi:hypothetical protein